MVAVFAGNQGLFKGAMRFNISQNKPLAKTCESYLLEKACVSVQGCGWIRLNSQAGVCRGKAGQQSSAPRNDVDLYVESINFTGTSTDVNVCNAGPAAVTAQNYPLLVSAGLTEYDPNATGNANFIWSDMSAPGHSTTTNDWTNGVDVPKLPTISRSLIF